MTSDAGATEYVDADLRDTGRILDQASALLDLTRPIALTLLLILHAVPDSDDPYAMVARLLDAVPPGSYLVVSHMGSDLLGAERQRGLQDVSGRMSQQQYAYRDRAEVARFFAGTKLVEPGLVRVEEWRPEPAADDAGATSLWCAVGRKR